MPYADLPVTRAMQPLKLKEYLASGRPAVVSDLPANRAWSDCLDVAETPDAFSASVRLRLATGLPEAQRLARARLAGESWDQKSARVRTHPLLRTGNPSMSCIDLPPDQTATRPGRSIPEEVVVLETRVVCGSGGGPDKTILNTPRFLASTRYRTLCAYMHPPGDPGFEQLRAKALAWEAPLISIPDRGPLDWRVVSELATICRRERVAIWHGHDYKSNLIGLLLRRKHAMRLVTTVHGWVKHTWRTPIYYGVDRFCLRRYERVLCVSEDLRELCLACGVPESRCVLIENGVDTRDFARTMTREDAKRQLGIPSDRLVVGAIGRLSAEKAFDLLIRAADRLLESGFDLELLIAGDGDEATRLQGLIDDLGRSDRIRLLGFRSHARALYQAMDVFALSSLREGLPNVLLEAMAMEVPVVATRIAGIPRLIRDRENGLLVEAGSDGALAGALARLLSDAGLRAVLRDAGRRSVEQRVQLRLAHGKDPGTVRRPAPFRAGRVPDRIDRNRPPMTGKPMSTETTAPLMLQNHRHDGDGLAEQLPRLAAYACRGGPAPLSIHPGWLTVLAEGLGHVPYCLEVTESGQTVGILPLCFIRSPLFGRFLVSLPYLNYGGVLADGADASRLLVEHAVQLADQLDVRYLELRHSGTISDHPALGHRMDEKVHMRLPLPATAGALWDGLSAKVRNQVRKAQKGGLAVAWGGEELLPEFHDVFSHNMRDLGTPSYGRGLFRSALRRFPDRAELCVVRAGGSAVAGAFLTHGWGITEVPSASSLRRFNHTNANMLMYWHLLERAVDRGQGVFDFGRSSRESNTHRFKRQWGATPEPATWQYQVRRGGIGDVRPDNPGYRRLIHLWQRLPVPLTRCIGPFIVRGIP